MNKNSKVLVFSALGAVLISVAACILRSLACIWHLEANLIYFTDTSLIRAADIIAVAGVVLLLSFVLVMEKESLRATFTSPVTYVPTALVAVAVALFGMTMLAIHLAYERLVDSAPSAVSALALLTAILTPVSIAHFFLTAFISERHARLRAYFSLGTVLMLATYASYLYFSPTMPLNAENKIAEEMACLFAAIFFLFETRISLGREMWRPYAVFGLAASLVTAYAAVPSLVCYFVKGYSTTASVESAAMLLSLSIFIFARVIMMAMAHPDAECAEMAALREWAERREEEVISGKIEDGMQISITELIDIPKAPIAEDGEKDEEGDERDTRAPEKLHADISFMAGEAAATEAAAATVEEQAAEADPSVDGENKNGGAEDSI